MLHVDNIVLVKVYSWLHGEKEHDDLISFQVDADLPVLRNVHIDHLLGTDIDQGKMVTAPSDIVVGVLRSSFVNYFLSLFYKWFWLSLLHYASKLEAFGTS